MEFCVYLLRGNGNARVQDCQLRNVSDCGHCLFPKIHRVTSLEVSKITEKLEAKLACLKITLTSQI